MKYTAKINYYQNMINSIKNDKNTENYDYVLYKKKLYKYLIKQDIMNGKIR